MFKLSRSVGTSQPSGRRSEEIAPGSTQAAWRDGRLQLSVSSQLSGCVCSRQQYEQVRGHLDHTRSFKLTCTF